MLYKLALIFESVNEILRCDHSNKSYWAALSCGAVYYVVQGGSNFKSVYEILKCDHSNQCYWAVLSCAAVYFSCVTVAYDFMSQVPQHNHFNVSNVKFNLPCGAIYVLTFGFLDAGNPGLGPFRRKLLLIFLCNDVRFSNNLCFKCLKKTSL